MKGLAVIAMVLVAAACQAPTTAQTPVTKAALVNGTSLAYQEQGTGLPVVFVHGGFSDHRVWETQRAAAASRYRFIALSLRYFGPDPWPDKGETFSQETHIADVARSCASCTPGRSCSSAARMVRMSPPMSRCAIPSWFVACC
jgi:hypothetical protein